MTIARNVFEREALALLPKLLGVARRLTRNDADAEDLVAETVLRGWRGLDSLANESSLRSWLFRILNNTFMSNCRRATARPHFDSIELDDDEEAEPFSLFEQMHQPFLLWFGNPEQAFLDKLLREDIEKALATLPAHHRMIVVLADIEELAYAEIAQALDVPVGTVRSRLARARAALQKLLWRQAQEVGLHCESPAGAASIEGGKQP
jgi:RNA polymerase sigma-70 factor, ECF subfamily